MQNDAAVFRTQETLEKGCKDIDQVVESYKDIGIQDRSMVWNTDLIEAMELENLLINATVTMHSAEARKVGWDDLHGRLHWGLLAESCCRPAVSVLSPAGLALLFWGREYQCSGSPSGASSKVAAPMPV